MAQLAVVVAVKQRLAELWTKCAVVDSNNASSVMPDTPFLTVQYPVANESQITIGAPGNNLFRESGAIRLVLTTSTGSGSDDWLAWVDELRAMFRSKQFDGVNTWSPSSPVMDDNNGDGTYWRLSFAVPYYFDFIS